MRIVIIFFFIPLALAGDAPYKGGYLGGSLDFSKVEADYTQLTSDFGNVVRPNDSSHSGLGGSVFAGYRFGKLFSLELMYQRWAKIKLDFDGSVENSRITSNPTGRGLGFLFHFPLNKKWTPFVEVDWLLWRTPYSLSSRNDDGSGLGYAAGIQYNYHAAWKLRARYRQIATTTTSTGFGPNLGDVSMFSAELIYFRGKPQ